MFIKELQQKVLEWDEIIKTEPTAENYYFRGFTKYKLGDFRGALPDYDWAVKMDPEISTITTAAAWPKTKLTTTKPQSKITQFAFC